MFCGGSKDLVTISEEEKEQEEQEEYWQFGSSLLMYIYRQFNHQKRGFRIQTWFKIVHVQKQLLVVIQLKHLLVIWYGAWMSPALEKVETLLVQQSKTIDKLRSIYFTVLYKTNERSSAPSCVREERVETLAVWAKLSCKWMFHLCYMWVLAKGSLVALRRRKYRMFFHIVLSSNFCQFYVGCEYMATDGFQDDTTGESFSSCLLLRYLLFLLLWSWVSSILDSPCSVRWVISWFL